MSKETAPMDSNTACKVSARGHSLAWAAGLLAMAILAFAAPAQASLDDFALESSAGLLSNTQAAGHADFESKFQINGYPSQDENGQNHTWGRLRDLGAELPPGLVGDPAAFPTCSAADFVNQVGDLQNLDIFNSRHCPFDSQVGMVTPGVQGFATLGTYRTPLYNLEAPGGDSHIVARLGFVGFFYPQFIDVRLDPSRGYALTAKVVNIPAPAPITGAYTTIWGVPTDPSHDVERFNWLDAAVCGGICPWHLPAPSSGLEPTSYMSNPTSCGPGELGTAATSYARIEGPDYSFAPMPEIGGCEQVPFEPSFSLSPTTKSAGASSGLEVNLQVPQPGLADPETLRTADLKKAVVTLPQGFALNPSSADGLGSCSLSEVGASTNEKQLVNVGGGGGPVSLTFAGQSTPELPQFASAGAVRSALEGLANVNPGDVSVSGRPGGPWTVEFSGVFAGQDVPAIGGIHSEVQQLSVKAAGGTYALEVGGDSTGDLPWNADAATVQAALDALPSGSSGAISVSGGSVEGGSAFRLVFGGASRGVDVPLVGTVESALVDVENPFSIYPGHFAKVEALAEGGSAPVTRTLNNGGSLRFNDADPNCPDSSKVATGEIRTPVLKDPLKADFYLARQTDNPFGSLFAGYLVAKGNGATIKLPARIDVDPQTGQITTTFDNNPQQPFEDLELHFKGGNRGLLTTPDKCGTYATTYELTPWSGNPPAKGTSEFTLDQNCADKPFAPGFHAGSETALAGSFTTFATQVTSETGAPALRSISVDLPEGLSASLAGVGVCSDAALGALPTGPGTGQAQIASPSCPASSQIGTVQAGAGSGSPFYVKTGKVYLAGPYKGAPLSLAVLTPAVAGPFDLGNVLVRVPVTLDRKTARVHAASDPIPTMLSGIPLDLRDVRVLLDRQGFALNPTGCEPKSANGVIGGEGGATANVSDRFQVGECAALGFKPKLALKLKGGTQRGDHPALSAILRPRPGDSNLASATVALPKSEFLDQSHIGTVCTRVQFQADQCPAASIYGKVTARTPLLEEALAGNVYLRSSDHKLPDLVMDLRGPASRPLRLEAVGRIDSVNGGIRTSFEFVPDAPITKVTLQMKGGKKGLLQNSRNICAQTFKATAAFAAHNGRSLDAQPEMQARCKGAARKGKGKGHPKPHGKSRG